MRWRVAGMPGSLVRVAGPPAAVLGGGLALLGALHGLYGRFFPNPSGRLGHDFAYFLPAYVDGYVWFAKNGVLSVPWFTPSFCAGLPLFADPQSGYYSLPQWLTFAMDPVTASYVTLLALASIGYAGMYRLCRAIFELPRSLSILAAGLYGLNGFLPHRIIIGEMAFHPLPLVPWIALWLLCPARDRVARIGYSVLAALAGAYCVQAGMNILVIPAALSVAAVMLIHGLSRPWRAEVVGRGALALAVCGGLSASKLVASTAFVGNVSRPEYAWPGFPDVVALGRVVALALFGSSEMAAKAASGSLVNVQWAVLPHEWAYQFSAAPLLALVVFALRRPVSASDPGCSRRQRGVIGVALAALLLVPLVVLYYAPGLNRFYKTLPIVGASPWPMRWLVLYVPLVPIVTALMVRRSCGRDPRAAMGVSAAILVLAVALHASEPRAYYHRQSYDPRGMLAAWAQFTAGGAAHHSIRGVGLVVDVPNGARVPLGRNDMFVTGVSPMACYNPVFGYRLEQLSTEGMSDGPILTVRDGHFNFKNPACYLYPARNGCRPGDTFPVDEREALSALAEYRPMAFVASGPQRAADSISLAAMAGAGVFVCLWGLRGVQARAGEGWRGR